MTDRSTIFNELRTISQTVAEIPFANVYTVDDAYFNNIATELFARIAADKVYTNEPTLTVPQGYFDGLSKSIFDKIKAQETNEIISETNAISTIVSNIGNTNIYTIPAQYFTEIPATILQKIDDDTVNEVQDETKAISRIVAGIGNENMYSLPANYFENIVFVAPQKELAKVVSFGSKKSIFKYAAAAVITGLLGLSIFNMVNKNVVKVNDIASSKIEAVVKDANIIIATNTFDATFEAIPDNEIEKYLKDNGQDVDAALVASSTDDATLPEATDYLFDENTLNNYLKENNLNN